MFVGPWRAGGGCGLGDMLWGRCLAKHRIKRKKEKQKTKKKPQQEKKTRVQGHTKHITTALHSYLSSGEKGGKEKAGSLSVEEKGVWWGKSMNV